MSNSAIAIITARGGSKRIPGKNIKDFDGEPIINYSIKAALKSGVFDEVMVSTDSREIANIAIKAGANIPFFRSAETSGDFATTADVLIEVIDRYKETGKTFDKICCIYPTAPFITSEKLKQGYDLLIKNNASSVLPLVKFSYPPQRCHIIDQNGFAQYKWPENYSKRSQDLEPLYHDAGQFYFYDTKEFIEKKGQNLERVIPLILSDLEVQDIDSPEDWTAAELKYSVLKEKGLV